MHRECTNELVSHLNKSHVALLPRLELVEHDVEGGVVKHEIHFVLVELADHGQRHVVVRINEHQVLDEQDVDDVGAVAIEHGDSGVALQPDNFILSNYIKNTSLWYKGRSEMTSCM